MLKKISIAIDAMGGDNSPDKVIEGIKIFLEKNKSNNDFILNIFGKINYAFFINRLESDRFVSKANLLGGRLTLMPLDNLTVGGLENTNVWWGKSTK